MYKIKMLLEGRMVKEAENFAKGRQGKEGGHRQRIKLLSFVPN